MKSRTITAAIAAPADAVYAFARQPENLPQWIPSFCQSVALRDGQCFVQSPLGEVMFSFVPANPFRVLDHDVRLPDGTTLTNPMRVIPNGTGCEVMFTLFQHAGMSDEAFEADAQLVLSDLDALKKIFERVA